MAWVSPKVYAILSSSEEGKDIIEKLPDMSQEECQKELDNFFGEGGKGASQGKEYGQAKFDDEAEEERYKAISDEEVSEKDYEDNKAGSLLDEVEDADDDEEKAKLEDKIRTAFADGEITEKEEKMLLDKLYGEDESQEEKAKKTLRKWGYDPEEEWTDEQIDDVVSQLEKEQDISNTYKGQNGKLYNRDSGAEVRENQNKEIINAFNSLKRKGLSKENDEKPDDDPQEAREWVEEIDQGENHIDDEEEYERNKKQFKDFIVNHENYKPMVSAIKTQQGLMDKLNKQGFLNSADNKKWYDTTKKIADLTHKIEKDYEDKIGMNHFMSASAIAEYELMKGK